MKIFISYSWKDSNIIDEIDKDFQSIGIELIRDIRDINYKDNIRSFMKLIRECDYAILIISDSYLKSKNCLLEVLEIRKEEEYIKKILPLLETNLCIYDYAQRINYIRHWEGVVTNLTSLIDSVTNVDAVDLIKELKENKLILGEIDNFIQNLVEEKCISIYNAKKTFYSDILSYIKFDPKAIYEEIAKINAMTDVDAKEAELELLALKYPNSGVVSFKKAYTELIERKNVRKAIVLFENHQKNHNDDSNALYHNLGIAYGEINQFDKAISSLNKAIELEPNNDISYFVLGLVHFKNMDFASAKESLYKSIEINPTRSEAHYYLGNVLFHHLNDVDAALIHYEKSLEINPNQKHAYSNLFLIYKEYKKDISKAENILTMAIEAMPQTSEHYYNYAHFCEDTLKDSAKAKLYFKKSISVNPRYIAAKLSLAVLEIKKFQNYERGIELLEDVLSVEPDNADALLNLAIAILTNNGDIENARKYYIDAGKIDKNLRDEFLDNIFKV